MSNPYDGNTPPPGGSEGSGGTPPNDPGQPAVPPGEPAPTPPNQPWGQQPPAEGVQPGAPGAPIPPAGPPAPPGSYPPGAYQGAPAKKTTLPVWSLVLSILSFLCFPVVLAIAGIITGFLGRSKAKREGSGTGMAVAGIIIGFVNIALSIVLVIVLAATGFAIFGVVQEQVAVAEELESASVAAEAYKGATGSYTGISTSALAEFGYRPSSDITVNALTNASGSAFCVEGAKVSDPENQIHMPADGANVTITVNGRSYSYGLGSCAPAFK